MGQGGVLWSRNIVLRESNCVKIYLEMGERVKEADAAVTKVQSEIQVQLEQTNNKLAIQVQLWTVHISYRNLNIFSHQICHKKSLVGYIFMDHSR